MHIKLETAFAHQLNTLDNSAFDLIILASTVPFFPGYVYLQDVIKMALSQAKTAQLHDTNHFYHVRSHAPHPPIARSCSVISYQLSKKAFVETFQLSVKVYLLSEKAFVAPRDPLKL